MSHRTISNIKDRLELLTLATVFVVSILALTPGT